MSYLVRTKFSGYTQDGLRQLYKGGGGGSSTNTTINYSPEEAARRAQVMDEAQRIYKANASTMASTGYTGAKPVDFSDATKAAQNLAVNNASAAQNSVAGIQQGVNYGLTQAMDVNNNPYLQQAMQAAVRGIDQNYTDAGGVMSGIRSDAGLAGQYGGSRQGVAEGIAASRHNQQVADTIANMATSAYDKGQDTFGKTLTFAPQAVEAMNIPVNMLSGVGAQQENLAMERENYAANARNWALNAPWMPLQNYASIVYGGATPSTSTETQAAGAARNPLGQAAGAGLTAASIYQMMQA